MQELSQIVETGPDLEVDGVVRWRRIDLVRVIEERFGVVCSERSITDYLAELGFSHISGRPQHPAQDARVIEAFKKTPQTRFQPTEPICQRERPLRFDFRMKRGLVKRTGRSVSGHVREPVRAFEIWSKVGDGP